MHIVVFGAKGLSDEKSAGGVERGCEELSKRLVGHGIEVTIYQRGKRGCDRDGLLEIRSIPFVKNKLLEGWSHLFLSFIDWKRHNRFGDIIHLHCAQYGIFALFFRLFGKPVLFHLHGPEWRVKKWGIITRFFFLLSCLIGVLFANNTVAVCETSKNILSRYIPFKKDKISIIQNGIPTISSEHNNHIINDSNEDSYILCVGRLVPQKRIENLIYAYKIIKPSEKLFVVGPESQCKKYVKYLKFIAGNDPNIIFTGKLDKNTLFSLYEKCKVLVFCSETEGCSNVLLEALYFKCPIVASNIEQNIAVLGDSAVFFQTNNKKSLIQSLTDVLNDEKKRLNMTYCATNQLNKLLNWDDISRIFICEYHEILQCYQKQI